MADQQDPTPTRAEGGFPRWLIVVIAVLGLAMAAAIQALRVT